MITVGDRVRFVSRRDGKKYVGKVTRVQPVSGRIEISFHGPTVKSIRSGRSTRATLAIRYPNELEVVS